MSDIAIRFDGLLLIASLAIAALLYFLVALGAVALRLTAKYDAKRLQRAIGTASLFGLVSLVTLALAAAYMAYWSPPASGPDWLDWLAIPVAALFALGCLIVLRSGRSPRSPLNEARSAAQAKFPSAQLMKLGPTAVCALALFGSAALAAPPLVGNYRLSAGPDVFGELVLKQDGRFRYVLGAGALDEHADGRWVAGNGIIRLYSAPRPKAATFASGPQSVTTENSLQLVVKWPNGSGIAGVDFTIGFDAGEPEVGYTQEYGWVVSRDEHQIPRWVVLVEPIHGITSQRFSIDMRAGNLLTYVLTPNDLGTADFDGTALELIEGHLVMHQRLGDLIFVRAEP